MQDLCFDSGVNFDNFTFNFDFLKKLPIKESAHWFKANYPQIQKHLMNRFRFIQEQTPNLFKRANSIDYLVDAQHFAQVLDYANSRYQPFSHLIALFGIASDLASCHALLFGESKPVILRGQTLAVIDAFSKLPGERQEKLMAQASAKPSEVTNPMYILFRRFSELAQEEGRPVNEWLMDFLFLPNLYRAVDAFKEENIPESDPCLNHLSAAVGATCLWWMSLFVCPSKNISADYLFRDDYSSVALHPNRSLSTQEKLALN